MHKHWQKLAKKKGWKEQKNRLICMKGPGLPLTPSHLHCIFSGAASIVNININSCSALKSVCEKTIWNEFNFGELHRKHSIQYYILQHFCINLLQLPPLLHSYKSLPSSGETRASNEGYPEACEEAKILQSRRRPLLGPSPGWKKTLLRHYAKRALTPW